MPKKINFFRCQTFYISYFGFVFYWPQTKYGVTARVKSYKACRESRSPISWLSLERTEDSMDYGKWGPSVRFSRGRAAEEIVVTAYYPDTLMAGWGRLAARLSRIDRLRTGRGKWERLPYMRKTAQLEEVLWTSSYYRDLTYRAVWTDLRGDCGRKDYQLRSRYGFRQEPIHKWVFAWSRFFVVWTVLDVGLVQVLLPARCLRHEIFACDPIMALAAQENIESTLKWKNIRCRETCLRVLRLRWCDCSYLVIFCPSDGGVYRHFGDEGHLISEWMTTRDDGGASRLSRIFRNPHSRGTECPVSRTKDTRWIECHQHFISALSRIVETRHMSQVMRLKEDDEDLSWWWMSALACAGWKPVSLNRELDDNVESVCPRRPSHLISRGTSWSLSPKNRIRSTTGLPADYCRQMGWRIG